MIKIPITLFLQEILKHAHFPKNPVEFFFNEKPKMKNCWLSEIFAVNFFAKRQKRHLKTFFFTKTQKMSTKNECFHLDLKASLH